jgi:hypothetical protein
MAEQLRFQTEYAQEGATREPQVDFAEMPERVGLPLQDVDFSPSELANTTPVCVHLDLEELECFEIVDQQFQEYGVEFSNAIALYPSNPAFPSRSGSKVLIGSPKNGWVEATFRCPVRFVSGFVTSSRRTVLAAFDANNQPVAQAETPGPNLAGSESDVPPNVQLSLKAANIHRITFYAFDGQLTLNDFSFSFQ